MKKEIKTQRRTCKFCKKRFVVKESSKHEFCSQICEQDHKRVTLYKKFGRGPAYEYICRALTVGNKTGDAYGITIPRKLVEEYNLYGKKFKVEVTKHGVFMIKTKIEYTEVL